jgi:N-acyl-L-homoserine lactone synthetase
MAVLHVVAASNRSESERLCDSMYRDRKRVFVDRLHWDLQTVDSEREIDQFDTADAVYVIEADSERNHLASLRLLPTTKPHLMSEVFPFLCDSGVPRGPGIWELTRLCIRPDLPKIEQGRLQGIVWFGALQYAFAAGIRKFTGVTHVEFLSAVLASGLDVEPLGLPQNYGGSTIGAHMVHFSAEDMWREQRKLGLPAAVETSRVFEKVNWGG